MTALLVLVALVSLAIAGVLAIYVRQLDTRRTRAIGGKRRGAGRHDRARAPRGACVLRCVDRSSDPEGPTSLRKGTTSAGSMFDCDGSCQSTRQSRRQQPRLLLIPAIGLFVVIAALSAIYVWNRPSRARVGVGGRGVGRAARARRVCDISGAAT